jgi:hypothetical protein
MLESKLIGTAAWGFTFGVAVRTRPYSADLYNDSSLYLYKVDGDKIASINVSPTNVSFGFLKAASTYVLSGKQGFQSLKAFDFSTLAFIQ